MKTPVKLIAQYFPQLHAIPENDEWWGPGFTDWVNVRRARPQIPDHYQPRVPLGKNYYDQSREEVVRWQAELARAHGIYAFCHYHYWFNGKQLLAAPTDTFLAHKDIDLKFCLAWANETWSRRWDGQDHHILIAQTHPPTVESWGRHFDTLIRYWSDERALRIHGKPVFLIYRPARIPQLESMFDYWQTRARRDHGIDGIYFVSMVQREFPPWETLRHFDAAMLFQPFVAMYSLKDPAPHTPEWRKFAGRALGAMPLAVRDRVQQLSRWQTRPTEVDYDTVWQQIIDQKHGRHLPTFEGAYVDWDNTARYRNRATIFRGATPEKFEAWMRRLIHKVSAGPQSERLVFINAWNEWAESAYLEPDERFGMKYLEALKRAATETAPGALRA